MMKLRPFLSIPVCCLWATLGTAQGQERQDNHGFVRLSILSTPGATCTYKRDGKILDTVVLPSNDNPDNWYSQVMLTIDARTSRGDIAVTCEKDGYVKRSDAFHIGHTPAPQNITLCDWPGGHTMSTCAVDRRYWPLGLLMGLTRDPAK